MRIANWSVPNNQGRPTRIRTEVLKDWLNRSDPPIDILALQKVGCGDKFPDISGYHSTVNGKVCESDGGVAVLTRTEVITRLGLNEPKECFGPILGTEGEGSRFVAVEVGGLVLSSVYAPYLGYLKKGGRILGEKAAIRRRVEWLMRLRRHLTAERDVERDSLVCGDFNVKTRTDYPDGPPKDELYSECEQDEFKKLLSAGFVDLYRHLHPCPEAMPGHTFGFSKERPFGTSRLHLAVASNGLAERPYRIHVDMCTEIQTETRPLIVDLDYDL